MGELIQIYADEVTREELEVVTNGIVKIRNIIKVIAPLEEELKNNVDTENDSVSGTFIQYREGIEKIQKIFIEEIRPYVGQQAISGNPDTKFYERQMNNLENEIRKSDKQSNKITMMLTLSERTDKQVATVKEFNNLFKEVKVNNSFSIYSINSRILAKYLEMSHKYLSDYIIWLFANHDEDSLDPIQYELNAVLSGIIVYTDETVIDYDKEYDMELNSIAAKYFMRSVLSFYENEKYDEEKYSDFKRLKNLKASGVLL